MKIDIIDNTLVCEDNDLQTTLSYIKGDRKFPTYIEQGIIKIIFKTLEKEYNDKLNIENQLDLLPKEFIEKTVYDINNMFSKNGVIDYNNCYLQIGRASCRERV